MENVLSFSNVINLLAQHEKKNILKGDIKLASTHWCSTFLAFCAEDVSFFR